MKGTSDQGVIFIPHYELRGDVVAPIHGAAAKAVSVPTWFSPEPDGQSPMGGLVPIVGDFNHVNPGSPEEILAFANRYGALGSTFWNPYEGNLAPDSPEVKHLWERVSSLMYLDHVARLCGERRRPNIEVRDLESALQWEPTELTFSSWLPEPLWKWRQSWFDFQCLLWLIVSLQTLLVERHGPQRARETFAPLAVQQLKIMADSMQAVGVRWHPELESQYWEWVSDSPVERRLTAALIFVQQVSSVVVTRANAVLRPSADLTRWEWYPSPPNVLNMLYLALFQSFVSSSQPIRMCALPECLELALPGSFWCGSRHAALHRKRRSLAKKKHGLCGNTEILEMERVVVTRAMTHDAAAAQIVAQRGKRRSSSIGRPSSATGGQKPQPSSRERNSTAKRRKKTKDKP